MTSLENNPLGEMLARGEMWRMLLNLAPVDTPAQVWRDVQTGEVAFTFPRRLADPTWQPKGWKTAVYIGILEPSHQAHLYRFLLRRARSIAEAYGWGESLGCGFDVPDDVLYSIERQQDWREDHPEAWLLGTDFMRALAALLIGAGYQHVVAEAEAKYLGVHAANPHRYATGVRVRSWEEPTDG